MQDQLTEFEEQPNEKTTVPILATLIGLIIWLFLLFFNIYLNSSTFKIYSQASLVLLYTGILIIQIKKYQK